MHSPPLEADPDLLMTHYKSIDFKASTLELYDRTAQGKVIGLRMQSMLPKITIPPHILQVLCSSTKQKKVGVCTAFKLSPTHYLTLNAAECSWIDNSGLPIADYLIYLKPASISKIADHLLHEDKLLENFVKSMEKIIAKKQKTEVLDLCRTMIMFATERNSQKLLLRCEIVFPYANLIFTPVATLKLVSSTLTKRLVQMQTGAFLNGFLTMDQNSRVVPLDFDDKHVMDYPIVGIWVKGIPQTNSLAKTVNLIHPLVWAACLQYILFTGFKEKVSACPQNCTFLFVDFSNKPKFYEVSCQKPPAWKTSFYSVEVPPSSRLPNPLHINFLLQDTRFLLKQALSESLSYISHSTCNSRSCTPPSSISKPPACRVNSSSKSLSKPKGYETIIIKQTKLIEKLQAQVLTLQTQVISPKSKSYCESPENANKKTTETNTSFQSNRLKSTKKIDFDCEDINDEMTGDRGKIYSSHSFKRPFLEKTIPKINYESSSESSEDESVKRLHLKYSRRVK